MFFKYQSEGVVATPWDQMALEPEDSQSECKKMCVDEGARLRASGVEPTRERALWARRILDNQPATTVQAMARSAVTETSSPAYLANVRSLVDAGMLICLLAAETSRAA